MTADFLEQCLLKVTVGIKLSQHVASCFKEMLTWYVYEEYDYRNIPLNKPECDVNILDETTEFILHVSLAIVSQEFKDIFWDIVKDHFFLFDIEDEVELGIDTIF